MKIVLLLSYLVLTSTITVADEASKHFDKNDKLTNLSDLIIPVVFKEKYFNQVTGKSVIQSRPSTTEQTERLIKVIKVQKITNKIARVSKYSELSASVVKVNDEGEIYFEGKNLNLASGTQIQLIFNDPYIEEGYLCDSIVFIDNSAFSQKNRIVECSKEIKLPLTEKLDHLRTHFEITEDIRALDRNGFNLPDKTISPCEAGIDADLKPFIKDLLSKQLDCKLNSDQKCNLESTEITTYLKGKTLSVSDRRNDQVIESQITKMEIQEGRNTTNIKLKDNMNKELGTLGISPNGRVGLNIPYCGTSDLN